MTSDGQDRELLARIAKKDTTAVQALFARQDGVEECWRIVEPALKPETPVSVYASGSWGPAAADDLIAPHGTWHRPEPLG